MRMFLKRLESVGFKSFAERIRIDFVSGVTAVVGPNGSGKSNVIDAIRWVLGEQSAKSLRGQKMEDVIFQGSDTRNPLNFAEVTLVLNNEHKKLPIDFNEVSITRRVYRSGDSDFLINKQACRLKDIVDLFMDTGLGRDSFSIISQGKIDEILSSKAEERRAIFEEAAGVLKYKQRKNRAQFKLEETKENLSRVEDIIYEIDQQSEPLKRQASIAKEYNEKKNELKDIEIALLVTEIEQLNDEWTTLLKTIEEAQNTEVKTKTRIQEKEATVINNQQKLQQLGNNINVMQKTLLETTEQLEQLEGKRNVYYERVKHLNENKGKIQESIQTIHARKQEVGNQLKQDNENMRLVFEKIKTIKADINELENKLLHGQDILRDEIEDLKSDYIEYLNQQAVLGNEHQSIKRQLEQLQETFANEQQHNKTFVDEKESLGQQKIKLTEKVSLETTAVLAQENKSEVLKARLILERENLEQMQGKLYQGNEKIAKITSRIEMLEEMKESYQGYFYGVKEVLKASKRGVIANIDGSVLDLIDVPEKYITAIDTILGAQVQHIVVQNDVIARETIQWLKQENKGRATFLPLESIEARMIPKQTLSKIEGHQGFLGIAADLIQANDKYEKVLLHLMGNVIITNNLQNANEIARLLNRRYRVVTLDGDIVFPGGSMSGGAKKQTNNSLFTREKELTSLKEKQVDYSRRTKEYIEKINVQRTLLDDTEITITKSEAKMNELKNSLQTTKEMDHVVGVKLTSLTANLTTYNMQKSEFEGNIQELNKRKIKTETLDKEIKQQIKITEEKINLKTAEQNQIAETERNVQSALHVLQISLAEQEERKKSSQEIIASLQAQVSELETEEQKLTAELDTLVKMEQSDDQEDIFRVEITVTREKRDSLRKELEGNQALRNLNVQLLADEERDIKTQYKLHEQMIRDIQAQEVKANRLDVSLENRLNHLQTEYVTTYERASKMYEKVSDISTARNNVEQVKQAIKRLGTVNLGAIEEYERIMERYTFLTDQKQDLLDAKETLYAAINEMDQEMIERFQAVFTDIQAAFSEVFNRLFDGGHAELILTEPANMLETGIEIVAQPPGKRMKSLGLLSGGERALTAIALLFAILKVKPVPFCILDEVDAALDEANVKRFSNYLKVYSEGTQFIVITHRNGTMEEADVLYGITMQESGVSRLVSVRLEELGELVELS